MAMFKDWACRPAPPTLRRAAPPATNLGRPPAGDERNTATAGENLSPASSPNRSLHGAFEAETPQPRRTTLILAPQGLLPAVAALLPWRQLVPHLLGAMTWA